MTPGGPKAVSAGGSRLHPGAALRRPLLSAPSANTAVITSRGRPQSLRRPHPASRAESWPPGAPLRSAAARTSPPTAAAAPHPGRPGRGLSPRRPHPPSARPPPARRPPGPRRPPPAAPRAPPRAPAPRLGPARSPRALRSGAGGAGWRRGRGFLALSGPRERSAPGFAGRKRRRRSRPAAAAVPCSPPRPRRHAAMAKWGQGDPRWIVEEREDGTNVNNWHWTERDATSWSKGRLRELLVGITVENEAGRCEISELKQVEGEASCSSRKGKLIFFYEWNIKLGWKGIMRESGAKHKGLIEIPSLSEENEVDDTEVNVSKKKGDGDILKDLMKTAGTAKVREALGDYLKALKTEFTMGMILPTKAMAVQELTIKRKLSENALQASSPVALGVRIPTVALHMTELFDTAIEQLYRIFTVKDLVQKFSKSSAVLEAEKGGKFQMFDGNITGEYTELLTNKKIVMKWRCRNWPEEHYAVVALNFVPTLEQTELQLDCEGVPICEEENMKFCWQKQHFEEIKGLLQLTTLNG
ncbi:hypothetical protein AB1E18_008793 [Capra hircus]